MKSKIYTFSLLLMASFFLLVACQKENIYESIDNRATQKVDPLVAIDRIMDTPVVMGKIVLDDKEEFKAGWFIDKKAKLHQFQLAEAASFPIKVTANSELLLETILKNTTELKEVNAANLVQKVRTLEELEHHRPIYRSGESDANTNIYFYFANVDHTTCEYNGAPISFVSTAGCDVSSNSLVNCTTANSITTMIIEIDGKAKVTLPYDLGLPLVSYINSVVEEQEESN